MLIALLLCGVALAAAQSPTPCNAPPQFEARFRSWDVSKNFAQQARMAYDETNRRVREIEEVEIGKTREYYDVLYLHNMNREYRINLRTQKCNSSALTRAWIPFGVPPESKYEGTEVIGPVNIANEHITVEGFDGTTSEGGHYFGTVSASSCVPVTFFYEDSRVGRFHRSFYDFTLGIANPEVFNIPSNC